MRVAAVAEEVVAVWAPSIQVVVVVVQRRVSSADGEG
jgi:hypothetical protein